MVFSKSGRTKYHHFQMMFFQMNMNCKKWWHKAVVFTAPTFEALQKEAKESLEFHIEGLVENGEDVPEWLKNGDMITRRSTDGKSYCKTD